MRAPFRLAPAALFAAAAVWGQSQPRLRIADAELSATPAVIGFGDQRFTDPKEKDATNPKVRRWLVDKIAAEKPAAVLMSGDVPWHGQDAGDYKEFEIETAPWRAAHILAVPAMGNHEVNGPDPKQCIENWWNAFPKLRGVRWYTAEIGSRMLVLNLDSTMPLTPGTEQYKWIEGVLGHLAPTVRFVFLNLHHPPAADSMPEIGEDHNARPNEIPLKDLIRTSPARKQAQFVVVAGHIHNYERFLIDGTTYLVSGGGGAKPRVIRRGAEDLYANASDINYHYVRFVLRDGGLQAEMVRVADPAAASPGWEVRDRFQIAPVR